MSTATASEKHVKKLKVGVYALTSCYGCQLVLAAANELFSLSTNIDFEVFSLLSSDSSMHEKVDLALVEGSVSTEQDLAELKMIRENSTTLVALGSCAACGGVQSWSEGDMSIDELHSIVYQDHPLDIKPILAKPIRHYVEVDFSIPGCPPEKEDIVRFLSSFVIGTMPEALESPVCADCRLAGNPCILLEKGEPCLGPVTVGGCGARCITFGVPCVGCRGPVPYDNAWFDALARIFKELGFKKEYIRMRMKIFGAHDPHLEEMLERVFGGED